MPWGVAAAAVAAGGAIYASNKQAKAAKDASKAQTQASDDASKVQLDIFNQQRADQSPFREAGLVGLNQYMSLLGLDTSSVQKAESNAQYQDPVAAYLRDNPDVAGDSYWGEHALQHYNEHGKSEGRTWGAPASTSSSASSAFKPISQQDAFAAFRATPGYQFGLDEGSKAVQASAAARGGLNSGSTLKALQKFGNDYADQQGYTPYVNRLASLAGIGQTATNQVGQYGTNYANQVGNNLVNAGNARASGIYGSANSWANGAQQVAGAAGQYLGSQYNPGGSNATLADGMWGGI